ncbi:unnamed protein product [Ixodes hexagonus]
MPNGTTGGFILHQTSPNRPKANLTERHVQDHPYAIQKHTARPVVVDTRIKGRPKGTDQDTPGGANNTVRQLPEGVGCLLGRVDDRTHVAASPIFLAHQYPGADCSLPSPSGTCKGGAAGHHSPGAGQYGSSGGHQQERQLLLSAAHQDSPQTVVMVLGSGNISQGTTYPGAHEHECRSSIQESDGCQQLETVSTDIPPNQLPVGPHSHRSLCRLLQLPSETLLQLETGPTGSGRRCSQPGLDGSGPLCLPTIQPREQMHRQTANLQEPSRPGSSGMAISAMVRIATAPLIRGTPSHTSFAPPAMQPRRAGAPNAQLGEPGTSSMETVQFQQPHSSLSQQAAHLIEASWRRGTQLTYTSCWRRWERWCRSRTTDPFSPTLTEVFNFLASPFKEGLAYRTIGCYRSALSQILQNFDGHPLGEHPAVVRLMNRVFNSNPPKPRYSSTWKVETVTALLQSWGSNRDLSLKTLTSKLTMPLALTSAGRTSDLCLLSTRHIRKQQAGWELQLDGLRKTSGPAKPSPTLFFPVFRQTRDLCPVECLEVYLEKSAEHRGAHTQLLLTTQKPFRPAARDTVGNWIKQTLAQAGIDTSVFKAHSTRGAATSKALEAGVPLTNILATADWSSDSSFNRFYRRHTDARAHFGAQVLST